jgi:cold shock CspA family protein
MKKGTLEFYIDSKGFGYINDTASSEENFVNLNLAKESMYEYDEAIFDFEE